VDIRYYTILRITNNIFRGFSVDLTSLEDCSCGDSRAGLTPCSGTFVWFDRPATAWTSGDIYVFIYRGVSLRGGETKTIMQRVFIKLYAEIIEKRKKVVFMEC
jgi:hypothetical protein